MGVCLLQAETRSDWVTWKSVNPHSGAFVAYCLTSQQLPGQGHYRIKERAERIIFFPDAIDLGLYLKVEFTGKDLQSDLDDHAAPEVNYQGGFLTFARVMENCHLVFSRVSAGILGWGSRSSLRWHEEDSCSSIVASAFSVFMLRPAPPKQPAGKQNSPQRSMKYYISLGRWLPAVWYDSNVKQWQREISWETSVFVLFSLLWMKNRTWRGSVCDVCVSMGALVCCFCHYTIKEVLALAKRFIRHVKDMTYNS